MPLSARGKQAYVESNPGAIATSGAPAARRDLGEGRLSRLVARIARCRARDPSSAGEFRAALPAAPGIRAQGPFAERRGWDSGVPVLAHPAARVVLRRDRGRAALARRCAAG